MKPHLAVLAAIACGCAEAPLTPLPSPDTPPRVERVLAGLAAEAGDACWMVPELLEEEAVGVRFDPEGAWVERIDFASRGEGRRGRARLDREAAALFLSRLEENGISAPPPASPTEGVRVWCRGALGERELRLPRAHPIAEVFRRVAEETAPGPALALQVEAGLGTIEALETGPVHYVDPTFGPDGAIYAKAAGVHRWDPEARRFMPAFPFPPGADAHRVQWEVPTRTLLAFQASRLALDLGPGVPSVSWNGRYAAAVRPSGAGSVLARIDLATDRTTEVLSSPRPLARAVPSEDGRWFAFSILSTEPGEPGEVRVYDSDSQLEFDPGEDDAPVHRPIAYSPLRQIYTFYRRDEGEFEYEVYLWSVERREVEFRFRFDPAEFQILSVLPDGRAIVRKAFVQPQGTIWRLGTYDFYTSNLAVLSAGDGEGPGSLHPSGQAFVYASEGDVFLWRAGR